MQKFYKSTEQFFKLKVFAHVRHLITESTHLRTLPIILKYDKKTLTYLKLWIANFIIYNFEDDWLERFDRIYDIRYDSCSKESFILRYGENDGLIKYDEKCSKTKNNKINYIAKYGEDAWYSKVQHRPKYSLESQIEFYGVEEGTKRWNLMLTTKLNNEKRNREQSEEPRRNGQTLKEYQNRYGIEDGYNRWQKRFNLLRYKNSRQRYIDEFGEEVGSKICRDIKANLTIERFIQKYGEIDGPKRFENVKLNLGITLDKMILKYGEELGTYKYNEWKTNVIIGLKSVSGKTYSKISQELFWQIFENVEESLKPFIYFAELNEEQFIYIPENISQTRHFFYPDFKCLNVIIEFDCDYWHDAIKDAERDSIATKMGFKILRIDYKNYKNNPKLIIDECIEFINKNVQIE